MMRSVALAIFRNPKISTPRCLQAACCSLMWAFKATFCMRSVFFFFLLLLFCTVTCLSSCSVIAVWGIRSSCSSAEPRSGDMGGGSLEGWRPAFTLVAPLSCPKIGCMRVVSVLPTLLCSRPCSRGRQRESWGRGCGGRHLGWFPTDAIDCPLPQQFRSVQRASTTTALQGRRAGGLCPAAI